MSKKEEEREDSPAYKYFSILKRWNKISKVKVLAEMMQPLRESSKLFSFLYDKTKKLYKELPPRKNGENPFVHPLNTVLNLQRAKITDEIILCCGLIHDYVEEKVDIYQVKKKINKKSKEGIVILDNYEEVVFKELKNDLTSFCKKEEIDLKSVDKIIKTLKLLTRHKRDFYYRSISNIFTHKNPKIKEMAIKVKLADRTHNILCVDCFTEQERIYQAFKNIFILNSVKKYLFENYGNKIFNGKTFHSAERLFNKCCKATFEAFFEISLGGIKGGIFGIIPMLQLSFKKYALEREGIEVVTKLNKNETHLIRLFQNVIRKYDSRLHHEWEKFEKIKASEIEYCKQFFKDYKFNEKQIKAIIDYKDAYALREVVTYLLYKPKYVIGRFYYSHLFRKH